MIERRGQPRRFSSGEVGAGQGYITFRLSRRVGPAGKVYANDIDRSALRHIQKQCAQENIRNIEIIQGKVEDPLFPKMQLDADLIG